MLGTHVMPLRSSLIGVLGGDAELGGVVDEVEGVVFGEAVDGGLVAVGEVVGEALGVFEAEGGGFADGFDEGDFVAEVLVRDEDDGGGVLGGDGGRGGAFFEADSEWHGGLLCGVTVYRIVETPSRQRRVFDFTRDWPLATGH